MNKEEFARRFREESEDFSDEELCRRFKISRPTITRWREGLSAPHPIGRESVFQLLEQMQQEAS